MKSTRNDVFIHGLMNKTFMLTHVSLCLFMIEYRIECSPLLSMFSFKCYQANRHHFLAESDRSIPTPNRVRVNSFTVRFLILASRLEMPWFHHLLHLTSWGEFLTSLYRDLYIRVFRLDQKKGSNVLIDHQSQINVVWKFWSSKF